MKNQLRLLILLLFSVSIFLHTEMLANSKETLKEQSPYGFFESPPDIGVVDIMPRFGGVSIISNSDHPVKGWIFNLNGILSERPFELSPAEEKDVELETGYYIIIVLEMGGKNRRPAPRLFYVP